MTHSFPTRRSSDLFLVLGGIYQVNSWVTFGATTGLILSACYMLWLYRRIIFGDLVKEDLKSMLDLSRREVAIFTPLILVVLWMGIYPASLDRKSTRLNSSH